LFTFIGVFILYRLKEAENNPVVDTEAEARKPIVKIFGILVS
jgi:hypothetical protein